MIIRTVLTAGVLLATLASSAQIQLGGGLVYGTGIANVGFQARGGKVINDQFDALANLTFFLPEKISGGLLESKTSLFTINFDGHYKALENEKTMLYPLAGINISVVSFDIESEFLGIVSSSTGSDTNIGLNIGGGGNLRLNNGLKAFGEVKYVISSFDQLVITVGIVKTL